MVLFGESEVAEGVVKVKDLDAGSEEVVRQVRGVELYRISMYCRTDPSCRHPACILRRCCCGVSWLHPPPVCRLAWPRAQLANVKDLPKWKTQIGHIGKTVELAVFSTAGGAGCQAAGAGEGQGRAADRISPEGRCQRHVRLLQERRQPRNPRWLLVTPATPVTHVCFKSSVGSHSPGLPTPGL